MWKAGIFGWLSFNKIRTLGQTYTYTHTHTSNDTRYFARLSDIFRLWASIYRHLAQRFPTFPSKAPPTELEINTTADTTNIYINHRMHNVKKKNKKQKCLITAVKEFTFCSLQNYAPCVDRQHDMHLQPKVTAQYNWIFKYGSDLFRPQQAAPWHTRLFTGLSPRTLGFNPRSVHVKFAIGKVVMGHGFLREFPVYPVSIIPQMLHIYLHLLVAVTGRTKPDNFTKSKTLSKIGEQWMQTYWWLY
jgi:hypothetical protein